MRFPFFRVETNTAHHSRGCQVEGSSPFFNLAGRNEIMKPIHNRMPVIIPMELEEIWLRPAEDPARLLGMLKPYPAEEMQTYEVSGAVNSTADDSPECIRPATPPILAQPVLPFFE
jgi:hypothetical protein